VAGVEPRIMGMGPVPAVQKALARSSFAAELRRRQRRYALCTMCIGVGQGMALVVERV
jgi:acetyl-CoA acyltransferase